MIQHDDPQAEFQFNRDLDSLEGYINRRYRSALRFPRFAEVLKTLEIKSEITATEQFAKGIIADNLQIEEEAEPEEAISECDAAA